MVVSTDDTQTEIAETMLNTVRSKTLQKLVLVSRCWKEHLSQNPLGALMMNCEAPPTSFIMNLLKCSRRSAHDYRVTIQLLLGEEAWRFTIQKMGI